MRRRETRTVGSECGGRVSRISAKGWPGNRAPAEGVLRHGVLAAPVCMCFVRMSAISSPG